RNIMCKEPAVGIIELVAAANEGDRLKLLNDESVPEGDLDNSIHPIFSDSNFPGETKHMQQAFRLASLFIRYDSVLEFFLPLVYGRTLTDHASKKQYISNPLASKSDEERALYFEGVREALHCLSHCVTFHWVSNTENRLWARTLLHSPRPTHAPNCTTAFQYDISTLIELNEKFQQFYDDEETGYRAGTHCDQFRHDFQFAATLIHELAHAFGIMRRGRLLEPYIRLDHPDNEWGYAWENFMFGAVINPQERRQPGTHAHLRKIWAHPDFASQQGGKEYCAIPVSWTAQWFRKETWARIEKEGPSAISPSVVQLKIVASSKYSRWLVLTDRPETQEAVRKLHDNAVETRAKAQRTTQEEKELSRALWRLVDSEELQESNVPIPTRIAPKYQNMS
ncbi:hypothetical protein BU26DRAFT_403427, partial [Trematosphaeria pertusa]